MTQLPCGENLRTQRTVTIIIIVHYARDAGGCFKGRPNVTMQTTDFTVPPPANVAPGATSCVDDIHVRPAD